MKMPLIDTDLCLKTVYT